MKSRQLVSPLGVVALVATLLVGACVDGPVAGPTVETSSYALNLVPQFGYAVAPGAPALSSAEVGALNEAFDLVNRFRLIVSRLGTDDVLLDVILEVTPGQDLYDLAVDVPGIAPGEQVSVVIIAMQGETALFQSPPLTVPTSDTQTATPPQPLSIPLTYTGPGAHATEVRIESEGAVLAPGGTRMLSAVVLDNEGNPMLDVPLGWGATSPSVASVSATGVVTGAGGGRTQITVTTPTGLTASVWVYVFGGDMTFIQGGVVMTAPVVGGAAQAVAGSGAAHGPVPTGNGVMYGEGGTVFISGVPIMNGSWPAPSPDGTKIAADAGGTILLANADGSGETEGPSGGQPAWASPTSLYVSGGSIHREDVVSGNRSLVVSGSASFPTVTAEGRLAYLDGNGQLFIQGRGPVTGVVTGSRPAIAGGWVLFSGAGGLMVAPTDGASPVMPLGMSGTDPAWGSSNGGFRPPDPPPAVEITGLDPDTPVPGQEVKILGTGFDPIIAANTRVFFPTEGGETEVEVLRVTATSIRVVVPRGVRAGDIRVVTLSSEATFAYVPAFGSVALTAMTPWGTPVAGVSLALMRDGSEVASGTTDAGGVLFLDGLPTGDYAATYAAPTGFSVTNAPPASLALATDAVDVAVELTPEVRRITIDPAVPMVEVGSTVAVTLKPLDINGQVIPVVNNVSWSSPSPQIRATGTGLSGTLTGLSPTATPASALFRVFVDGTGVDFFATVTSFIEGTLTLEGSASAPSAAPALAAVSPVPNLDVVLMRGGNEVGRATSDGNGRFRFGDLPGGDYTVKPLAQGVFRGFTPGSIAVTLDADHPTGKADFKVHSEVVVDDEPVPPGSGEVVVFADVNFFGSGAHYLERENHKELLRNLSKNGGRTRVVWYNGHTPWNNPGTYWVAAGDYLTGTLGLTLEVVTGSPGSLSIPADAASFWMVLPGTPLMEADFQALRDYVSDGGRVVLVGENSGSSFNPGNARVQEIMNAMGSSAVLVDGCNSQVTTDIASDPLMQDVLSVQTACSSYFNLGSGDQALINTTGGVVMARIHLGDPVSPAPSPAPGMFGAPAVRVEAPVTGDGAVDPADPNGGRR